MKKKKILIIVDQTQRDLDGTMLLTNELTKKNYEILLLSQYDFHLVPFLEPNLIILHHGRMIKEGSSGNDVIIKFANKFGIQLVVLDNEGSINFKPNHYLNNVINTAKYVDKYFLWNNFYKKKISKITKDRRILNKIVATGSPRSDLYYHKYYKLFFKDFKINFKKYILINTNFTQYNSIDSNRSENKKFFEKTIKKDFYNNIINEDKLSFIFFLENIKNLFEECKHINFILRSHPFENSEIYKKNFKKYKNVSVNDLNSVIPYLYNCNGLIHRNSTSALEADYLNKFSIFFDHKKKYKYWDIFEELKKISKYINDYKILKKNINKIYNSKKKKNTSSLSLRYLGPKNGDNHKKIADEIHKLLKKNKVTEKQNLFYFFITIFRLRGIKSITLIMKFLIGSFNWQILKQNVLLNFDNKFFENKKLTSKLIMKYKKLFKGLHFDRVKIKNSFIKQKNYYIWRIF